MLTCSPPPSHSHCALQLCSILKTDRQEALIRAQVQVNLDLQCSAGYASPNMRLDPDCGANRSPGRGEAANLDTISRYGIRGAE